MPKVKIERSSPYPLRSSRCLAGDPDEICIGNELNETKMLLEQFQENYKSDINPIEAILSMSDKIASLERIVQEKEGVIRDNAERNRILEAALLESQGEQNVHVRHSPHIIHAKWEIMAKISANLAEQVHDLTERNKQLESQEDDDVNKEDMVAYKSKVEALLKAVGNKEISISEYLVGLGIR